MRTRGLLPCLLGAALLLGCGAPSNFDICHATCEQIRRCVNSNEGDAANCHNRCNNNKGALSDKDASDDRQCRNAGARRAQTISCLNEECSVSASCLLKIDSCIQI